jgi:hypothetical protein
MYAYATIIPLDNGKIIFRSIDKTEYLEVKSCTSLPIDGRLNLLIPTLSHQNFPITPSFEVVIFSNR